MILESLRDLAEREGLVDEPAFQSVPVRWVIDLDEQGKFQTLDDTAYMVQEEGKRKPRQEFKRMSVPRRTVRPGQVTKPEFLVDNAQYVLGIQPEGAKAKKIPMETYRRSFVDLLRTAKTAVDSPVLNAAIAFLENEEQRGHAVADLQTRRFGSGDWITFRLRGKFIHEAREVCDWWVNQNDDSSDDLRKTQCLVCGRVKPPARIHDKLTLEGTGTFGAPLVGFNKEAFEKHGLSGNENAPVCRTCMVAYVNALRRCLDDKFPRREGGTFPQQSVRLNKDTTAVYWDDQSSQLTGSLWWLDNENPSVVKHILESAWKGERPAFSKARFYCLILTGAEGRAVVRGMHTSTVEEVSRYVESYFNCIELVSRDGRPAPIYELLRSLVRKSDQKDHRKHLQPWLAAEVFLSAVLGKPLSNRFLAAAVSRIRAERDVTPPRAALLILYFQRKERKEPKGRKFPMSLDIDSTDPAYRYGRLLAVLEALQINYHNGRKPNSTIVDRFYAAASTRPATVFPRLLTLAQNHLKTASYATFFSKQITEVLEGLDGANGFRPMLSIEQQGRFALGYFHQRADRFKKSAQTGEINLTSIEPATEVNQA
jgi:CRISPR-associated protein Csd1